MTSKLVQALSRFAGNRQSDGTSSLINGEDREAIITGCYDLMVAARQAPAPQDHLRAIADAAQAYVDAVNGEPEKDCWDTEDGKEAPGALRFASDWAWQEYDVRKQKAFDALRAATSASEVSDNG